MWQLFDLFGDARLSHHVADGFSVILEDSDEVLNAKCHAVTRVRHGTTDCVISVHRVLSSVDVQAAVLCGGGAGTSQEIW